MTSQQKPPGLENVAEILPLSPTQSGMLFEILARDADAYHAVITARLTGPLEPDALSAAFSAEMAAQDLCRSCFIWEGQPQPVQVIRQSLDLPFSFHEGDPAPYLEAARALRFDLSKAPLMHVWLVRTAPEQHQLIWACHHMISDGWSTGAMLQRIFARLGGETPPPPASFRSYLGWLGGRDAAKDRAFWKTALAGCEDARQIAFHGAGGQGHARAERRLDPALLADLQAAAQAQKITLPSLLQAAWALTLSHLSGAETVLFGESHAGRPAALPGIADAAGPFVTTVPACVRVAPGLSLSAFLAQTAKEAAARQAHAHTGLAAALAAGAPGRESALDTLFVMESPPQGLAQGGLRLDALRSEDQTSFPFAILLTPGDTLLLEAVFDTARVPHTAAAGMLAAYETVLARICCAGDPELGALLTPPAAQIQRGPPFKSLSFAIHEMAARCPEATALVCGDARLSYSDLDKAALGIAEALRAKGIGPGDIVPVLAPRGPHAICAMLGALYAGAAYAPMDPDYPAARKAAMLEAIAPRVVLTAGDGDDAASELPQIAIEQTSPGRGTPKEVLPGDLAYVIFTSGSTGTPKGVKITHGNLSWSTFSRDSVYGSGPRAFLHLSSFAFDSSVVGIYWTLAAGGTLVIAAPRAEQNMPALLDQMARENVSHILCLPALYAAILEARKEPCAALDTVILAGEALPADLARAHMNAAPEVRLFNEYGPTEASVWCAAHQITASSNGPVPIGKPPPGAELEICAEGGMPLPAGIEGELVVFGAGVSPGYLNAPDTPFVSTADARAYRTGDRAVARADGAIICLGRMDAQIKIRGHRVEPEDLAAALRRIGGAEAAVAVAKPETGPELIAATLSQMPAPDIMAKLREDLPAPLLPAALHSLKTLPRLPNGKVDLAAIAAMGRAAPAAARTGPAPQPGSAPYLAGLVATVSRVLRSETDAATDFFAAGGDSLKSISVMTLAEAQGIMLRPNDLFEHPVLGDLAAVLARRAAEGLALPDDFRMVATTHDTGPNPPFMMLHGSPQMYRALAQTLGPEQPLAFAFSAYRGGLMRLDETIEEMAAACLDALTAWKPGGPYAIGGYSVGGTIALELAHQIIASGREVSNLVLLDPAPLTPLPEDQPEPRAKHLRRIGMRQLSHLLGQASLARYQRSGAEEHRLRFCNHAYQRALLGHRPKAYSGAALLLSSRDTPARLSGIMQALPARREMQLPFQHLEFQTDPEAMAAWAGQIKTALADTKKDRA